MEIREAQRVKAKIKIHLAGVSFSGKTVSALLLAYGIVGDWSKIYVIDTENKSADLCVGKTYHGITIGKFKKIDLEPPYTPARYVEAIKMCIAAGAEVVIPDSMSHEWEGMGGCLDMSEKNFGKWQTVTPEHEKFKHAILHSPTHVITTARKKEDYVVAPDAKGAMRPHKVGLKDITREGWAYEVTIAFDIDRDHLASVSKDRTELFKENGFILTHEHGKMIKEWCEQGEDEWEILLSKCKTRSDVVALYQKNKLIFDASADLLARLKTRTDEIVEPPSQSVNNTTTDGDSNGANNQSDEPPPVIVGQETTEPTNEIPPVEDTLVPKDALHKKPEETASPEKKRSPGRGRKKETPSPETSESQIPNEAHQPTGLTPEKPAISDAVLNTKLFRIRNAKNDKTLQSQIYTSVVEDFTLTEEQRKKLDSSVNINPVLFDNSNM